MLDIDETLTEAIKKARINLEEDSKQGYKVVMHPSVISYDYRIAWTWDEMEKRNKSNIEKDRLRLAFGMPARPYGRYSERTTHRGKDRGVSEFGHGKTDIIGDWW